MYKISIIGDATGLGCNKVDCAKTGAETGTRTIDDNEPGVAEGEMNIIARYK